jgi:hypothetical protein
MRIGRGGSGEIKILKITQPEAFLKASGCLFKVIYTAFHGSLFLFE